MLGIVLALMIHFKANYDLWRSPVEEEEHKQQSK